MTMQTTIHILIRNIYGNQNAYPNCDTSRLLLKLTGKKTFSAGDLTAIQSLGYTITFSHPEVKLGAA